MRSSLDTLLDIMIVAIVLAIGLPTFTLAFSTLLYQSNFGFGSLHDKSIISTASQERDLFDDQYLADKRLLTDAHVIMIPSVDDKLDSSQRTIRVDGTLTGLYRYDLTEEAKLAKGEQIELAANWFQSIGGATNFNLAKYHINLSADGSVIFTEIREEVQ